VAIEIEHPRRLVTLQRDGADFVVCFYPEEIIVFCHNERTLFGRCVASFDGRSSTITQARTSQRSLPSKRERLAVPPGSRRLLTSWIGVQVEWGRPCTRRQCATIRTLESVPPPSRRRRLQHQARDEPPTTVYLRQCWRKTCADLQSLCAEHRARIAAQNSVTLTTEAAGLA
jgi:hypothetical protein